MLWWSQEIIFRSVHLCAALEDECVCSTWIWPYSIGYCASDGKCELRLLIVAFYLRYACHHTDRCARCRTDMRFPPFIRDSHASAVPCSYAGMSGVPACEENSSLHDDGSILMMGCFWPLGCLLSERYYYNCQQQHRTEHSTVRSNLFSHHTSVSESQLL